MAGQSKPVRGTIFDAKIGPPGPLFRGTDFAATHCIVLSLIVVYTRTGVKSEERLERDVT